MLGGVSTAARAASGQRLVLASNNAAKLAELQALFGPGITLARLGGDEFVILLSGASSERVMELGSGLREQFQQYADKTVPTPQAVTLSIGANVFDQPPASLAALIEQGDVALYQSKRGGRDSIRFFERTVVELRQ